MVKSTAACCCCCFLLARPPEEDDGVDFLLLTSSCRSNSSSSFSFNHSFSSDVYSVRGLLASRCCCLVLLLQAAAVLLLVLAFLLDDSGCCCNAVVPVCRLSSSKVSRRDLRPGFTGPTLQGLSRLSPATKLSTAKWFFCWLLSTDAFWSSSTTRSLERLRFFIT